VAATVALQVQQNRAKLSDIHHRVMHMRVIWRATLWRLADLAAATHTVVAGGEDFADYLAGSVEPKFHASCARLRHSKQLAKHHSPILPI
jgi:hypothetical protein